MSVSEVDEVIASFHDMAASWKEGVTVEQIRRDVDTLYTGYPADCAFSTRDFDLGGVPCREVRTEHSGSATIMHLHGGGFSCGSRESDTPVAARLSEASGARVIIVDYGLVPEHTYPRAHEDSLTAYRALLDSGTPAGQIAISGDSSGGGMALSLLQQIRKAGLPMPACGILMSPWADLECTGKSYVDNAARDPITSKEVALGMATAYLGADGNFRDPVASPVHGDFAGLPPLLIDVGDREIFLDDSRAVAEAARKAGVSVTYTEWPGMIHVWHLFASKITQGREAIAKIGAFVKQNIH
jgi:acetyl esterase/lipase